MATYDYLASLVRELHSELNTTQDELKLVKSRLESHLHEKEDNGVESYPQQSTCHGLRYISDTTIAAPRRRVWLFLYIVSVGWYLYFTISAFLLFFAFPVTSNTEIIYVAAMDFPVVTICATAVLKQSYYEQSVANGSITAFTSLMDFVRQQVALQKIQLDIDGDLNRMTERDLYNALGATDFNAIYVQFVKSQVDNDYEYHYQNGGFTTKDIMVSNGTKCALEPNLSSFTDIECNTIRSYYHTELNLVCHTISFSRNGAPVKSTLRKANIVFEMKMPEKSIKYSYNARFHISIHDERDYPTKNKFKWISQKSNYFHFSLKVTNVTTLPWPHGNCEDTLAETYKRNLKSFPFYNRNVCRMECEAESMKRQCGCTLQGYPFRSEVPACKVGGNACTHSITESAECLLCEKTCDTVEYEVDQVSQSYELLYDRIIVDLVFKELAFTEIRQSAAYPAASLFGDVGGQLGLFIGASLLTLVEMCDLAIVTLCKKWGGSKNAVRQDS